MAPNEPGGNDAGAQRQVVAQSRMIRGALFFAGVVLPVICFAVGFPGGPEWRSGGLDAYAQILLWHVPSLPLYWFLLYSMVSMGLVVLRPGRFDNNAFIRFGVFSGVLVAAEYWVVFQVAVCDGPGLVLVCMLSVLAVLVPAGILWLDTLLIRKYGYAYVSIALLIVVVLLGPSYRGAGFLVAPTICLACSTSWALAAYAFVSARLIWAAPPPRFRFSLAQLLGATTWFAAHCGAWRASCLLMLQEYSRLPAAPPPTCFVCSAAARGHSRLVGSQTYVAPDGTAYRVNDQLRRLKAFELLLASLSPACHRALRRCYDCLGPRLAAFLTDPIAADAAYIGLKPAEWLARLCLCAALPGQATLVGKLYRA
jgi:hypothetical protein